VVVIPTRREKGGLVAEAGHELETETAPIEVDGAIEISHLEVDVADVGSRRYRRLQVGHDGCESSHVQNEGRLRSALSIDFARHDRDRYRHLSRLIQRPHIGATAHTPARAT
jgi:hypothetical protein